MVSSFGGRKGCHIGKRRELHAGKRMGMCVGWSKGQSTQRSHAWLFLPSQRLLPSPLCQPSPLGAINGGIAEGRTDGGIKDAGTERTDGKIAEGGTEDEGTKDKETEDNGLADDNSEWLPDEAAVGQTTSSCASKNHASKARTDNNCHFSRLSVIGEDSNDSEPVQNFVHPAQKVFAPLCTSDIVPLIPDTCTVLQIQITQKHSFLQAAFLQKQSIWRFQANISGSNTCCVRLSSEH